MTERSVDDELKHLKGQIAGLAFTCGLALKVASGREKLRKKGFEEKVLAAAAALQGRDPFSDGFNEAVAQVALEFFD